ncbi:MAG: YdeI/OmpD-associated family protein [Kibdelosporangium sp.]
MKFRAVLELGGKTATGVEVPEEVVEKLASGKRPAVKVTINSHTYPSTVARMAGRFMLPVSAENRTAAGVEAGDEIEVHLELDSEPRAVVVPDDLAAALDGTPAARAAFDKLAYSHQRRWVLSVSDAKTPETRQRRIDKAVHDLREA